METLLCLVVRQNNYNWFLSAYFLHLVCYVFSPYFHFFFQDSILDSVCNISGEILEETSLLDVVIESRKQLTVTEERLEEGLVNISCLYICL